MGKGTAMNELNEELSEEILSRLAEIRIRRWLKKQNSTEQAFEKGLEKAAKIVAHPYIAISREVGANAGQVADEIANHFGWEILGKELLDHMAAKYGLPRDMLEFLDETSANWMIERFGKWVQWDTINQEEYVRRLGLMVLLAANHGNVVFLGRGAQFFLPQDQGLVIRIIAPKDFRIENIMAKQGLDREAATEFVNKTDKGRADFVERYFHRDVTDPTLYDLVINSSKINPELGAYLALEAYVAKWKEPEASQLQKISEENPSEKNSWFVKK